MAATCIKEKEQTVLRIWYFVRAALPSSCMLKVLFIKLPARTNDKNGIKSCKLQTIQEQKL